ncbi:hypothetical protein OEA41_005630 [Lepraria neglecta]|uniref:Uncharacterized protein n=1 Tax=Lepraria neglecta TaxID=209136 RepID=A0AAD9Z6E0_9LECA|nr:hypothetical protein OEA41_005630 [Lepraria neglecta]
MADLDSQSSQLDSQASNMINAGLVLLMSDVPSFINFVQNGTFSGANPYSLPATVNGLDLGLKMFIVSTAIGQNLKLKNAIVGVINYVPDNYIDPASTQTPVGCILETAINQGNYLYNDATLSCDINSICTWSTTNTEFWNGSIIAISQAYLLQDISKGYLGHYSQQWMDIYGAAF